MKKNKTKKNITYFHLNLYKLINKMLVYRTVSMIFVGGFLIFMKFKHSKYCFKIRIYLKMCSPNFSF